MRCRAPIARTFAVVPSPVSFGLTFIAHPGCRAKQTYPAAPGARAHVDDSKLDTVRCRKVPDFVSILWACALARGAATLLEAALWHGFRHVECCISGKAGAFELDGGVGYVELVSEHAADRAEHFLAAVEMHVRNP